MKFPGPHSDREKIGKKARRQEKRKEGKKEREREGKKKRVRKREKEKKQKENIKTSIKSIFMNSFKVLIMRPECQELAILQVWKASKWPFSSPFGPWERPLFTCVCEEAFTLWL